MEHRKSILKQPKLADGKPQAATDSVYVYVFVFTPFPPRENR